MIQAFESKVLDLRDFYFTGDDYRCRFELEANPRVNSLETVVWGQLQQQLEQS